MTSMTLELNGCSNNEVQPDHLDGPSYKELQPNHLGGPSGELPLQTKKRTRRDLPEGSGGLGEISRQEVTEASELEQEELMEVTEKPNF